jgi:signal transduction histidine kinase
VGEVKPLKGKTSRVGLVEELVLFDNKLATGEMHLKLLGDQDVRSTLEREFGLIWAAIFPYLPTEGRYHFPTQRSRAYATANYYDDPKSALHQKWEEWQRKEFIAVSNIHQVGLTLYKAYRSPLNLDPEHDFLREIRHILRKEFGCSLEDLRSHFQEFSCLSFFSLALQGMFQLAWKYMRGGSSTNFDEWFNLKEMPEGKWPVAAEDIRIHVERLIALSGRASSNALIADALFTFAKNLYLLAYSGCQITIDQAMVLFTHYKNICQFAAAAKPFRFEKLVERIVGELKGDASNDTLFAILDSSIPFNFATVINLRISNLIIKPLGMGFSVPTGAVSDYEQKQNFVGLVLGDLARPISEFLPKDKLKRQKFRIFMNYLVLPVMLHDRAAKEEQLKLAKSRAEEMLDFAAGFSHEMSKYLERPRYLIQKIYDHMVVKHAPDRLWQSIGINQEGLKHAYSGTLWLSDINQLFVRYLRGTLQFERLGAREIESLFSAVQERVNEIAINDNNLRQKLGVKGFERRFNEIRLTIDCANFPSDQYIACDPEALKTSLVNMVTNSINQFSETQGTYVAVKVLADNGVTRVLVEDDGSGFRDKKQADNFGRPGKQGGAGIGAKLVKMIVRSFGGDIVVRNPRNPTVVELSLPSGGR